MALNDPTSKMSKSIPGSYIALHAEPDEIRAIVRKAVTDTGPQGGAMSPGVANLFTLLEAFSAPDVVARFRELYDRGELRYVDLKQQLAEDIVAALTPIRERRAALLADEKRLRDILREGAERARVIAREGMAEVREKTGLALHPRP